MKTINPYTLKGGIIMTNMNLLGTALLAGLAAVAGAKAGVAAYSIADEQNKLGRPLSINYLLTVLK